MAARRRRLRGVLQGPVLDAEIELDGRPIDSRFVMIACLRIPSLGPALFDDSLLETPKNERRRVRVGCDGESVRVLA
jgi:hypothetical protein